MCEEETASAQHIAVESTESGEYSVQSQTGELSPVIIIGARRPKRKENKETSTAKKIVVRLSTTSPDTIVDLRKKGGEQMKKMKFS